jgi:hypothetical protein
MPGRRWYLVALLLALLGAGAAAIFLMARLPSLDAGLVRMVVPGEMAMDLQRGSYTIFHEYRSVFDGRLFESDNVSGLRVTVSAAAGEPVSLTGATDTRYSLNGHSGISLAAFEVDTPGRYTLVAAYRDRQGPEAVLAVGRGIIGKIFGLVLATIAIALAGIGGGIALASVTYVKRRRAREAKP